MSLSSSSIIAFIELSGFIPALVLSFIACQRHGFSRSSGFYFTFTLSLFRIAGASCQLASISNGSTGLLIAATVLDHIGLSPLLLATLGIISRQVDWVNMGDDIKVSVKYFRIVQLAVLLAAIFAIIGLESTSKDAVTPTTASPWTYVAVICYIVSFVTLLFIFISLFYYRDVIPVDERILIPAVAVALPLIGARLVYQVLVVFVHDGIFSRSNGSILVRIVMALIEEFIVSMIYIGLGFKLRVLDNAERGPIQSREWRRRCGRRAAKYGQHQYAPPYEAGR